MKVAHTHPGIRGLASYCLNLYEYFTPKGVEKKIVSEYKWTKKPIPVFEPKSSLIAQRIPWMHNPKEVEDHLYEWQPDILHHHHPSGRLDFNVGKIQKKLDNIPLVVTVHMSVGSKKYFTDWAIHSFFQMTRKHFNNADCFVAISKFVQKQMIDLGIPKEKIVLLYAGVDPETYKPVSYEKHDELNVTFVGQMTKEKGVDNLINTVKQVAKDRKIKLNLIGNGAMKDTWMKQTKNDECINWVGFLNSPEAVGDFYAKSDVVVLPTRWDEAFSYIPLEAQMAGTAMIASNVGGNRESIIDGETGLLFDNQNLDELYNLLKTVEIEKLWDMGAKAREHMMKVHTLDKFGEKYHSLYTNLIEDRYNLKQID